MTTKEPQAWQTMQTGETRMVEEALRKRFKQADSYRYNSASIRVRVIDPSFEGMSREERDAKVEAVLDQLPEETQKDIVTLFTFAPSEIESARMASREFVLNSEFEDPSRSML